MPGQRIHHNTISRDFPAGFPQRLKRFKEESRLPWAEIARLPGIYPHTAWRWQGRHSLWKRRARPLGSATVGSIQESFRVARWMFQATGTASAQGGR